MKALLLTVNITLKPNDIQSMIRSTWFFTELIKREYCSKDSCQYHILHSIEGKNAIKNYQRNQCSKTDLVSHPCRHDNHVKQDSAIVLRPGKINSALLLRCKCTFLLHFLFSCLLYSFIFSLISVSLPLSIFRSNPSPYSNLLSIEEDDLQRV